jgi:hypothetical protein
VRDDPFWQEFSFAKKNTPRRLMFGGECQASCPSKRRLEAKTFICFGVPKL